MKTKFLMLFVLCVMAINVSAQTKDGTSSKLSIGGMIGLPSDEMSTGYNFAYGADLKAEFSIETSLAVTIRPVSWIGEQKGDRITFKVY